MQKIPFSEFYIATKNKNKLAQTLNCTPQYLWMLAKGKRRPSPDLAKSIEVVSGGSVSAIELLGLNK